MPALFLHSESDDLVPVADCEKLLKAYAGKAERWIVPGGHNSVRPTWVFDKISTFLNYHCVTEPTECTACDLRISILKI